MGALKSLAVHAALPAVLLLGLLLSILLVVTSAFTLKSQPADLNDAYLYITELDAGLEQAIRGAGQSGLETAYFINGCETPAASLRIQTDADYLLLYLDAVYETAGLAAPISGLFGGQTIREEIAAIHSQCCSYTVDTIEEETENAADGGAAVTVIRQEVHISMRSVRTLLSGSLRDDQLEIMRTMRQLGVYAALETLGSPFAQSYYIQDRWGWYTDSANQVRRRQGAVLIPLAGSGVEVYSCASGVVETAGAGEVSVLLADGSDLRYGQLTSIAVSPGQTLNKGDQVGTVSSVYGLYLQYDRDGTDVNPVFYLFRPGVSGDGADLVAVAESQIGNVGGQLYWSWLGFPTRVEWCACFISWCANECGYVDAGILPKTAGCITGVDWFKSRGLWQGRDYVPSPGDIIYFDWDCKGSSGPQDGLADHVGIVARVEDGIVYTVEGNSSDRCRQRSYQVGYYEIYGYGTPEF